MRTKSLWADGEADTKRVRCFSTLPAHKIWVRMTCLGLSQFEGLSPRDFTRDNGFVGGERKNCRSPTQFARTKSLWADGGAETKWVMFFYSDAPQTLRTHEMPRAFVLCGPLASRLYQG